MANCIICGDILVKGNNYPQFTVEKDKGIDICNYCWMHTVPKYIPEIQKEKYLIKKSIKSIHDKL